MSVMFGGAITGAVAKKSYAKIFNQKIQYYKDNPIKLNKAWNDCKTKTKIRLF